MKPSFAIVALCAIAFADPACAQELIESREGHRLMPEVVEPTAERIQRLEVPAGFGIGVFASGLGSPRMMHVADDGTIYITRPNSGDVIALQDADGDGKAEDPRTIVDNLRGVHDITIRDGVMYLCTVQELYSAPMENGSIGELQRIFDDLPVGGRHPNRTIAFGPDERLYVSVGSTCNACVEENPESAAILRLNEDMTRRQVFAKGLRNTVGFGWHAETGEMWGMDHGTDWLGDDFPPEELNQIQEGNDYGWPFVYAGQELIELSEYPTLENPREYAESTTPMVLGYTAHAAPIQMTFYEAWQFPNEYKGDAFVAMRGSWNRQPPAGYEIARVDFENGQPKSIEPFVTGFLIGERTGEPTTFARPAGIAVTQDGSLLLGDDANGVIYRIFYEGAPAEVQAREQSDSAPAQEEQGPPERLYGTWKSIGSVDSDIGPVEVQVRFREEGPVKIMAWSELPLVGKVRDVSGPYEVEGNTIKSETIRGGTSVQYRFEGGNLVIEYEDGETVRFRRI